MNTTRSVIAAMEMDLKLLTKKTQMQATSEHITRALELACDPAPKLTMHMAGRQGDVVIRRIGDAQGDGGSCPTGGWLIAAGKHGEHRLIAPTGIVRDGGIVDLPQGGQLVHTDVPNARHGTIALNPGRFAFTGCKELGLDGIVQQVKD